MKDDPELEQAKRERPRQVKDIEEREAVKPMNTDEAVDTPTEYHAPSGPAASAWEPSNKTLLEKPPSPTKDAVKRLQEDNDMNDDDARTPMKNTRRAQLDRQGFDMTPTNVNPCRCHRHLVQPRHPARRTVHRAYMGWIQENDVDGRRVRGIQRPEGGGRSRKKWIQARYCNGCGNGWDFSIPSQRSRAVMQIDEEQQHTLILIPECKDWCQMMNVNLHRMRREDMVERMRKARLRWEFTCKLARRHASHGRFFVIEQPQTARSWAEPITQELIKPTGAIYATIDQGQ